MTEKKEVPGLYLKKEWGKIFEMLSNEEVGILINNMYRLSNNEELLDMNLPCQIVFLSALMPTQQFNIERYNKRLAANSKNGAKGGAPLGNQNAKNKIDSSENNPIQHKETEKGIDKVKGTEKGIVIGKLIENEKTNIEVSEIEVKALIQSSLGLNQDSSKKSSTTLPPGAMTLAEYERSQRKF
jgi:hypothetical protein